MTRPRFSQTSRQAEISHVTTSVSLVYPQDERLDEEKLWPFSEREDMYWSTQLVVLLENLLGRAR
jgi:hypothetical protein